MGPREWLSPIACIILHIRNFKARDTKSRAFQLPNIIASHGPRVRVTGGGSQLSVIIGRPALQESTALRLTWAHFRSSDMSNAMITSFELPFSSRGFCEVALYSLQGLPTHAARQIDVRTWSSKLGKNVDLHHTLRGLEGPLYGQVTKILKKKSDLLTMA